MEVLKYGAEKLREKTVPVRHIDQHYEELAQAMLDMLHKERGVGLAGPQIGVMERIYVVHIENDTPKVFINPSILETSETTCVYEEGCLSIPGVWADIVRPERVRVQAWNEKGRPFTLETAGLLARVIQHEYDHLEGILYFDHLSPVKRERLLTKYQKNNKKGTKE